MGPHRRGLVRQVVTVVLLAGLLTLGAAASWLLTLGWADLRSELVVSRATEPALATKGRMLLEQAAQAHGLEAWRTYRTAELVATDLWATDGTGWWPNRVQRFRAERLLGTFTSRVELLDGDAPGEIWGLTGWAAYKVPAGAVEPVPVEDPAIAFYLPTLQYFDELPFRLLGASVVVHAGSGRYDGSRCERVFVTWERPEPHEQHDQYELWIDAQTALIRAVRYTVRDAVVLARPLMRPVMRAFAVGTMHFADYRRVDGVMVPFVQTVTLGAPAELAPPATEGYFHKLVVEDVRFGTVPSDVFAVLPGSQRPADEKP